nr:MAG: replication associated protein [Cressdnaviricota sp.]
MQNARSRSWCFTLNNPLPTDEQAITSLRSKYVTFGREVGSNGTPHLQGFIHFVDAKSLGACRRAIPRAHWEIRRGSIEQARTYCHKDGDFVEAGTPPKDPEQKGADESARWQSTWENAQRGELDAIDAELRIRYYATLNRIRTDFMGRLSGIGRETGIWVWGPSGSGKTTGVIERFPEAYPKPLNKWWDGYTDQEVIYLDDVDPGHSVWLPSFLKVWGGGHPFIAEVKGNSRQIIPKLVIVTSQYPIDQVFTDRETREAITRRFIEIKKEEGVPIAWPDNRTDQLSDELDEGGTIVDGEEEISLASLDLAE